MQDQGQKYGQKHETKELVQRPVERWHGGRTRLEELSVHFYFNFVLRHCSLEY